MHSYLARAMSRTCVLVAMEQFAVLLAIPVLPMMPTIQTFCAWFGILVCKLYLVVYVHTDIDFGRETFHGQHRASLYAYLRSPSLSPMTYLQIRDSKQTFVNILCVSKLLVARSYEDRSTVDLLQAPGHQLKNRLVHL